MTEKRYYIVKDDCDRLVAIFTDLNDCLEFIDAATQHYDEVVI